LAGEPRLNQIQVIGTHNSYHLAPDPAVRALIAAAGRQRADALDYSHRPLAEQFSQLGIRQIELDLYADPEGKLFAEPAARQILRGLGKDPGPDPDPDGRLRKPGMKVLHVPDVDQGFLVRTRADADTAAARSGDVTQRDKALASGAQFVSTDYPEPDPKLSGYRVGFPGGVVARPNPVSGDAGWGVIDLESGKKGSGQGSQSR
jgi:hypothetical protein